MPLLPVSVLPRVYAWGICRSLTLIAATGYSAHVHNRDNEGIIAEQQVGKSHPLGSVVDVLMGGGRCFFQPQQTEGSCRSDDVDLISWAEDNSFKVVTDRDGFDSLGNSQLPYIGLFHEDHMNYELDRNPAREPSLFEMSEQALKSLKNATSESDKGASCEAAVY
jgi:alkaline phosphatase